MAHFYKNPTADHDYSSFEYRSTENLITEEVSIQNNRKNKFSRRNHQFSYNDFETIDWYRDLTTPNKIKYFSSVFYNLYYASNGWIAVTLVGLITGFATFLLFFSSNTLFGFRLGFCSTNILYSERQCNWPYDIMRNASHNWVTYEQHFVKKGYSENSAYAIGCIIYVLLALIFAMIGALIPYFVAPYAVHSSIAEVKTILNGFVIHGYLGVFTAIFKFVSIIMTVGSGLNIGFESTLVYIGAASGNFVSRLFPKYRRLEAKKREIISSGAAAGISSAFNAPIGGVLFGFEEASHYFSFKTLWRTFWCSLISALFCHHFLTPFYNKILFKLQSNENFGMYELIPFSIIGFFGV
uniref:H(+)/Cl(-) exchange transporter 3 (Trinotate prediction) n=1 Tax=Henneguya salminicola TaxID=69463 RepID=A0A6G3MEV8_HENSL